MVDASETTVRVVLGEGVTQDDIDDAMADAGNRLVNVVPPTPTHPGQMIYATKDRRRLLYLVDDSRLGVSYLAVAGEGSEGDLEDLRERLAIADDRELAALVAPGRDDAARARALAIVTLTAGDDPSEAAIAVFAESLEHPSVAVRYAALVALTYVVWPALRSAVERAATSDDDAMVRIHAGQVLELYSR